MSSRNRNQRASSTPKSKRLSIQSLFFPYHVVQPLRKTETSPSLKFYSRKISGGISSFQSFLGSFVFQRIYAAEKQDDKTAAEPKIEAKEDFKNTYHYKALEALAKVYIQRETGMDRIKMILKTDHRGKSDPEFVYIQLALIQVFVLTFFFKYVPVAKFARKEFIRENQGTVFKTRFEAIRRLQDHVALRAVHESALFSTKITLFSANFLLMSSMIAAYRNKTSVWEYAIAAGITGGLARVNMGLKGFIAGSVVGGFLGSLVGVVGYTGLKAYGITQEDRHLEAVINKLDILKSIEGNDRFKSKINEILAENQSLSIADS